MKGFIVHIVHSTINEKTIVKIYGRLENGESFLATNKITPYFFIKESEEKKISKYLSKFKTEKVSSKNFEDEKVIKISAKNQTELNKLYNAIRKKVHTYEGDIKPHYRFLFDNDILGTIELSGDFKKGERVNRTYKEPKISSAHYAPKLKIASIDTEWDKNSGKLFCIGIYSENYKKNFMITDKKLMHTISCKDEKECLEKFRAEILEFDPDIITGWNLIDFDLKQLEKLFIKHKVPFDLGRESSIVKIRIESEFFKSSSAEIEGRQVIDGINLVRDPFIKEAPSIKQAKFESFTLEDVSNAILKSGKSIKGKNRHEEISSLYKSQNQKNLQKLVDYNILDCKLVYDILKEARMIELAIERSQLTGLPLNRLTASIAAFDSLYIREARKKGFVSPTTEYGKKEARIKGGYVQSLKAGIYYNVLILDFKSLYPSIMKTFNIDPASYLEKPEKNSVESPNKAYFKNQQGILPEILEKLHNAREKAKKEKRELSSYAIKIIMNSFFGVLASPNCRYFNLKMANAITHFGQMLIQLTAKEIEKLGYKTIYSDTDSVFIASELEKEKANELGKKIQNTINDFYKDYVKKKYDRTSYLELEFQKQYLSLMIPHLRGSEEAAKKRYAGLIEENGKERLEIVGLEAIRGDWTEAAQDFQKELLKKLFKKEKVEIFIKDYIKKIKSGELDKKLVYRKSIRKSLSQYTKITPPHVKAARQLDSLDSNIIEYYMTEKGPEPIQKLKHKIDYEHYIKKQIEPIANQILELFDKELKDVLQSSKQARLF